MTSHEKKNPAGNRFGLILVICGVALFTAGVLLRNLVSGTIADTRLLEGLGILAFGWGIIPLVTAISARRNPTAARRSQLAGSDERAIALRNQAAYIALMFSIISTSLVLLLYSAFTRGQAGFDPIWMGLAFLVIAPALVFMGVLGWLNNRQ